MIKLIGVSGKARAGKDTFAAACVAKGYRRIAFADALKVVTALVADEEANLYFDDFAKEQFTHALGMTRRQALQNVGKSMRDALGPDVWVQRALREWNNNGNPPVVISDCRYPNEADAIRTAGGIVVRVSREGSGLEGAAGKHESEIQLPDDLVDVEIDNNGTVGELNAEARKIVAWLESQE